MHESRLVTIIKVEMEESKCFSYFSVKVEKKNGKIIIPSGIFKETIFLVNSENVPVIVSNQVSEVKMKIKVSYLPLDIEQRIFVRITCAAIRTFNARNRKTKVCLF